MGTVSAPIPMVDLSSLSEQERDVLNLRFVADLPLNEVAKMLGVTAKRVRNIQGAALRKARQGQTAPALVRQRHRIVTLPPAA